MNPQTFTIDLQAEAMAGLYRRIDDTRMPMDLAFDDNDRGPRPAAIAEYLRYWRESFDWPAMVEKLNALPHFMIEVDGQPLHFLHIRSEREDATPLMLLHGFPGSFLEFLHVIEPLSNPNADQSAFHLVIPSHPGYLFSTPVNKAWSSGPTAALYAQLMADLGYAKYLVHGGDYGAFVGPDLGRVDPEHVKGIHVSADTWGFIPMEDLTEEQIAALPDDQRTRHATLERYGNDTNWYFDVQSKRPLTLAFGMSDSPSALLSWLLNLFIDFSDPDHPLADDKVNREIFFANLTLYWLTNCFSTSANTYWEGMHNWGDFPHNSGVPTGVANFKLDIAMRAYSEEFNTITHWSEFDEGGHFNALEAPESLVGDIRAFAQSLT